MLALNEQPCLRLSEILRSSTWQLADNPNNLRTILNTHCAHYVLEIELLISVAELNIPHILQTDRTTPITQLLGQLKQTLMRERAISLDQASWSIHAWANALNIVNECSQYAFIDDLSWLEKLAKQGNSNAQYQLGTMYEEGRGVKKHRKKAANWYEKAAQQGNSNAQYQLGCMYASGTGIRRDDKLAVYWFQKAATLEHDEAQFYLSWMYICGRGVDPNEDSANYWLKKSLQKAMNLRKVCSRNLIKTVTH